MTRRWRCLLLLPATLLLGGCFDSSVRSYVADNYDKGERQGEEEKDAEVYTSGKKPTEVADDIAEHRKPGDRHTTPSGLFLRYSKDFVAVLPQEGGGSRILIEDEDRGYAHFYPILGGWWGSYGGRGETFRGGGPGGGK